MSDLCGSSSDHNHADEEYGRAIPDLAEHYLPPSEPMTILRFIEWEAAAVRTALAERDDAIRKGRKAGVPVAKLAEAAGLTGPGVRSILARGET